MAPARVTDQTVLLYFRDYERDSYVPGDRYLKRVVKPVVNRFRPGPKVTGFQMWLRLLVTALGRAGRDVRVNDHRSARRNPGFPVGLVGYPMILDDWDLPNPAVLGPALFDHPEAAPDLMADARFRTYLLTCQWMEDLFATIYPRSALGRWYGGTDLALWPDTAGHDKPIDVVVYDKIRFDRDERVADTLRPMLAELDRRGLRHHTLRYGAYDHDDFRRVVAQSRAMLFVCEHETQGMAYQQALAMNVPILAWDPGYWCDPSKDDYERSIVPTTSVPYFSDDCGATFSDVEQFMLRIGPFLDRLDQYAPREYVRSHLSLDGSADAYLAYYDRLRPS